MLSVTVNKSDDGQWAGITRRASHLSGGVFVGYFAKQGGHVGSSQGKRPITLGDLARIHEQGLGRVPKRAFVKPAITANRHKYAKLVKSHMTAVLKGRLRPSTLWQLVGQEAVKDIGLYMTTATFTPLAPATIKAKGSSKPLIDTGQLRQSVTYQVK